MTKSHDFYTPRQSRRVDHFKIVGDGDLWIEKKGRVLDGSERSYFRSVKTGRCKWSEPPTGASRVVYFCELYKYPLELQTFALEPYRGKVSRTRRVTKHKRRYRRRPAIGFEE